MPPIPARPPIILADLRRGGGCAAIGESHIGGAGTASSIRFYDLFCAYTGQRARYHTNAGIGSQKVSQIVDRIDTDIVALPQRPRWCLFSGGFNDIGNDTAASTILATYITGTQQLRAARIQPIVVIPPPSDSWTSAQLKEGAKYRAALRDHADDKGYPVFDCWTDVVATDAGYLASMTSDGVHLSYAGARTVAASNATALLHMFPRNTVALGGGSTTSNDCNLLGDATFTGAATSGLSDAWSSSVSGGTVTYSQEADGSTGRYWQVIDVSSAPTSMSISKSIGNNTVWSVGDELELSLRVTTVDLEANPGAFYIRFDFTNGSSTTDYLYNSFGFTVSDLILTKRVTIPSGTTAVSVRIGWNSGTGVFKFAQPTVLNRTTLGLTA